MRKLFTIFPLCIVLCLLTGGCFTADANEENYEEEIATVSYDNNTDYMSLMVQYAAAGNMDALGAAVTARNEKIANQQLGYEQLSVDEFLNNYESYTGFSLDTDYMSQMVSCCLSGDVAGGLEAERLRKAVVIGGMEPMMQIGEVTALISLFRENGCTAPFVIYTGYYPSEISKELDALRPLGNIVVKFGRFIPNKPSRYDDVLGIELSSDNQFAERIS